MIKTAMAKIIPNIVIVVLKVIVNPVVYAYWVWNISEIIVNITMNVYRDAVLSIDATSERSVLLFAPLTLIVQMGTAAATTNV